MQVNKQEIIALETPFGLLTVLHNPSGLQIPFSHSIYKHTFQNGVTADVHTLIIDTKKYAIGESFQLRVGNLNKLRYYSSDENTVMYEYHDDKNCMALIGTETYYDEDKKEFYTGRTFSFTECPSELGFEYLIVRDPHDESLYETLIETRIVWLPLSDQYDAAYLIDIELV